ncbi:MAG: GNAT family N-acetyltransferase [Chloroflexi bacterium]|nr:GNAT family N-acetyltransferase [Chloroflexota bacterium]
MTLHSGCILREGCVSLRPPDPGRMWAVSLSPDWAADVEKWLSAASAREDVYLFAVFDGEELVGQIFLHDIQTTPGESLVGYHLFQPGDRGRSIGTRALRLLQQYVVASTELARLTIITAKDNLASRRVAEKCGFAYVGTAREDDRFVVYQWSRERPG